MGILYREIVIHSSEGRDVFLDIIELLIESISRRLDQSKRTLGSGTYSTDGHRIFDAGHERLTIPLRWR